jgi:soluble lytic murein transglycosylase-like protein
MGQILLLFALNAQQQHLPPGLLESVCWVESRHVVSAIHHDDGSGDSLGICQVKYKTAKWLGFKGTEKDLMKPGNNIKVSAMYLRYQINRYKNVEKALIAYNRGNAKNLTRTKYSIKVINKWRDYHEH